MTISALSERAQLTRSNVPGQQQHASPAQRRSLVVLEAVVCNKLCYILMGDLWKLRELSEQSPKIVEHSLDDGASLRGAEFGHRQLEISVAHTTQPAVQMISDPREYLPDKHCATARQESKCLQKEPGGNELEQIAKGASLSGNHAAKLARRFEGRQIPEL